MYGRFEGTLRNGTTLAASQTIMLTACVQTANVSATLSSAIPVLQGRLDNHGMFYESICMFLSHINLILGHGMSR